MLISFLLIPILTAIVLLFIKKDTLASQTAIAASLATLALAVFASFNQVDAFDIAWLPNLNSRFTLQVDGLAKILILLTAISLPAILIASAKNEYKQKNIFISLLLFTQAGLMGVFLAGDALLFYFFWELALIPVYFLSSIWGGEKRIAVTFKFFIYTFIGSLLMLVGLLYMFYQTADASFSMQSLYAVQLSGEQQSWLFWLFFVAFAVKMPVFPFHTWQPDTYEQSPTAVTMVLSALMVKMGLFAVIRWLLPLFPDAAVQYDNVVIGLSVIGMIYASILAMQQDDIKRLIAYSSIAHIGLMAAALFVNNESGLQGAMIQLFSHGVNVLGMWIVIELIERRFGTRKMSELGGLAQKAPGLTILLVIVALANVALPLTNAFIGEFLMFNGLFKFNVWYAAVGGLSIILSAIYTLRMIQKVFYGSENGLTAKGEDITWFEKASLAVIVVAIFVMGIYPKPVFELTADTVTMILGVFN